MSPNATPARDRDTPHVSRLLPDLSSLALPHFTQPLVSMLQEIPAVVPSGMQLSCVTTRAWNRGLGCLSLFLSLSLPGEGSWQFLALPLPSPEFSCI